MPNQRRSNLLLTEFIVQVYEKNIDWGGLDTFLWHLLRGVPTEDLLRAIRKGQADEVRKGVKGSR